MIKELENLLSDCRSYIGGEPSEGLGNSSQEFLRVAKDDLSILVHAAGFLESLEAHPASWLAVVIAVAVEDSGNAETTTPFIEALFHRFLLELPELSKDGTEVTKVNEYQETIIAALPYVCQSLVAHVARSPQTRERLSRDLEFRERLSMLEAHSHGITWVKELLSRVSGSLTLLHPTTQTGLRIKFDNVGNCFHLFSLIQHCLNAEIPGSGVANPKICHAALGGELSQLTDSAWWHYGTTRSAKADLLSTVWGEDSVLSIPDQTIVLWPRAGGARTWDSGFFSPQIDAAPPKIELLEKLTLEECTSLLDCFGIDYLPVQEKRQSRKWWKVWQI